MIKLLKNTVAIIATLASTHSAFSVITDEAKLRFTKCTHQSIPESIQSVPAEIRGLGYHWFPIVVNSDVPYRLKVKGPDMEHRLYSEGEIVEDTVLTVFDYPGQFGIQNETERFLDPKEVTDAIDYIKSLGCFEGFYSPSYLSEKLMVETEVGVFYFEPGENFKKEVKDSLEVSICVKSLDDSRIFTRRAEITIKEIK